MRGRSQTGGAPLRTDPRSTFPLLGTAAAAYFSNLACARSWSWERMSRSSRSVGPAWCRRPGRRAGGRL